MSTILLFASTMFAVFFSNPVDTNSLTINVSGITETKGKVMIAVYDRAETFPDKGKPYTNIELEANASSVSHTLTDLPDGDYAVALYHDANNDGVCNRNWIGIPKERFGFSTNFNPKLKAPKFEQVKFSVPATKEINIKLLKK